ncbi:hypothetical protein DKK70_11730 [Gilliamella apicola]|uniref:DUF7424 domain-containing protein n=1 Tax=Gilliamella apicola TaxID=1196095 RepID=A0A2V4DWX5_9GAMM|nr:hypothetical protein [Gilliamella apicola]PXZ05252.1 hypothetical protein DKK70_11730 [Gilliamella apicola]
MKKILISLMSVVLLSGCKVELAPTVNLSDINSDTAKTIQSKLIVEVTSCTDYKDSRNESSSLIEAKKGITDVFSDAKYVECYRENMDSKALFEIPITVGGKEFTGDIQLANADFGGGLVIKMSPSLKTKIDKASKAGMSKIQSSVTVKLKNDTSSNVDIVAHSVYLNDKPVTISTYTLLAGKENTFKLSDVSVSSAFDNGVSIIYEDLNNRMKLEK